MLDLKAIRQDPAPFRAALARRHAGAQPIDQILQLDADWRRLKAEGDGLRSERNKLSMDISAKKKAGEDIAPILARTGQVSARIKALDDETTLLEKQMEDVLLTIPNSPHESVPDGPDESGNVEVRKWGTPAKTSKDVKAHHEVGERLGMDFERGVKLSGSRFTVMYGDLARLERAIAHFMLDNARARGYREASVPYLVSGKTMTGTGQLPKFADDLYRIEEQDLWLIPTAEVPLTNLHAGEVIEEKRLPLRYCALTPCFRLEAGNYQKDIKGLIRQHQFHKVELVKFSRADRSFEELEALTADAESVLQKLGLPYRTVLLCTGDMGFSSAKTYDIEVWLPSQDKYREISSCSNCTDFQARRADIKTRVEQKNEHVHTLNGSGLAVGRTLVAILENYQDENGIEIPQALRPFMGMDRIEFSKGA